MDLIELKAALRIDHDDDDALLGRLLLAAEAEALSYTGLDSAPADSSDAGLVDVFWQGVAVIVTREYEADPSDREVLTQAARSILGPAKLDWGA